MKTGIQNILIIFMILALVVTSCTRDNFLAIQPKGDIIPKTVEDFRLLLDNINPPIGAATNGFDEKHSLTSLVNDNHTLYEMNSNQNFQRNAFLFEENFFNSMEQDPDWDFYYGQIFLANIIIEGLQSVSNGTAEEIAALEAEARLHRAYAYFNLVNIYALHYDPNTASTAMGVPIRQGIELEDVDLTRATVQETYKLILNDILFAVEVLPDTQPLNLSFRPSRTAAWGLLAKVYLYQAEYQLALDAVNEALLLYSELRNLSDDPIISGVRTLPIVIEDPQIIWFKRPAGQTINLFPSDEVLALYDPSDHRNDWFRLQSLGFTIGERFQYTPREQNQNFADGINTPELYLIRAECNARLSNLLAANDDINLLRENRFSSDDFSRIDITEQGMLLDFVKNERRRELIGNYDRTFDIKRYNLFDNDNISLVHNLGERTATLEANSPNWAFPIGEIYIQQNPEIIQNPRN